MFYSITTIFLAAQALSTAALSQSYPCYSLATSQNQSQAQIHTNEDFPAAAADQNTSQFPLGGLACIKSAYMKTSSSEGGGAQTQPQRKDEETTKEKSKVTSQSSDEDDYILDESGCPDLTKNMFYCLMCGGSDENGKCKGDPEDDNEFAGCKCNPDPDWSVNPPGLVRPQIREHRQAIRDRHLLRDAEVEGSGRARNVSSSHAATVAVFTRLPLVTISVLPYFASKQ
ncbi:hypothetical protein CC80DRAFT_494017 [Byssothecium circinans]|uniref:Uncharacterized protein n=1 Tax=Byssothecium circinans TaxID=147558 RepID=A0A6A5TR32_9PLEO|nr:hypothetical protein CC80DRAFT_494017 [Byssothecium circinans]